VKVKGQAAPDHKVDNGANVEELLVEIARFAFEDFVVHETGRGLTRLCEVPFVLVMSPMKQLVHSEKNRNRQHRHHRQHDHRVFRQTPHDDRPTRASGVLNDDEKQTAQGQREPVEVGGQIGKVEVLGGRPLHQHVSGAKPA
jgi:hypothetical protein